MTAQADALKYFGIVCVLLGSILCVLAAIAQHAERMGAVQ